jgi:hypothetical protein
MRRLFWILSLLAISATAAADGKAELQELYAAVNMLSQEQQALYQQFQMLQELRRANDRAFYASQFGLPQQRNATGVPNYADFVQNQSDAARRGEELARQTDQLYEQYTEVGTAKAKLRQRILELTAAK